MCSHNGEMNMKVHLKRGRKVLLKASKTKFLAICSSLWVLHYTLYFKHHPVEGILVAESPNQVIKIEVAWCLHGAGPVPLYQESL